MIELYMEIGGALAKVDGLKWVDIGPRVEEHTNIYPAAFIQIPAINPANLIGGSSFAEIEFEVEIWTKPYNATTAKPLSPVLNKFSDKLTVIRGVRHAIDNLETEWINGTTLLYESTEKQKDGFYRTRQKWKATTYMDQEELVRIVFPEKLEIEIKNGAD